jgi:hypothetical protein
LVFIKINVGERSGRVREKEKKLPKKGLTAKKSLKIGIQTKREGNSPREKRETQ